MYGVLILLGLCFAIFYEDYLAYFTLLFLVCLPVLLFLCLVWSFMRVQISVKEKAKVVDRKQEGTLLISVTNQSILPVPKAVLELEVKNSFEQAYTPYSIPVTLVGKQGKDIPLIIKSEHVGVLTVRMKQLVMWDYLQLFFLRKKINAVVKVTATPILSSDILAGEDVTKGLEDTNETLMQKGEDASEIFEIREYQNGDKLHKIHWKLTSKLDQIMVKEFSEEKCKKVTILLDLSSHGSSNPLRVMDTLFDVALTLSTQLAMGGIAHKILWYSEREQELCSHTIESLEGVTVALSKAMRNGLNQESVKLEQSYMAAGENGAFFIITGNKKLICQKENYQFFLLQEGQAKDQNQSNVYTVPMLYE